VGKIIGLFLVINSYLYVFVIMFYCMKYIVLFMVGVLLLTVIPLGVVGDSDDRILYLWSRDEPATDGVTDVDTPTFGDTNMNVNASCYWLIHVDRTGYINYLEGSIEGIVGEPGNDSFGYDIYIAETGVSNLSDNSSDFADMNISTMKYLLRYIMPYAPVGYVCRLVFTQDYYLEAGKTYIVAFVFDSAVSYGDSFDYIECALDDNTSDYQYRRTFDNGSNQRFTRLPAITLGYDLSLSDKVKSTVGSYVPIVIVLTFIGVAIGALGIDLKRLAQ